MRTLKIRLIARLLGIHFPAHETYKLPTGQIVSPFKAAFRQAKRRLKGKTASYIKRVLYKRKA